MKTALIITTYNRPDALELVLLSVSKQKVPANQIIVADDGSKEETKYLLERFKSCSSISIQHCWQEDQGFRLARIRNKAIAQSDADYILMIDGDLILHPDFVGSHIQNAQKNYFVQGSRVLLSEKTTQETLQKKQIAFSMSSPGITNRLNAVNNDQLSKWFSSEQNDHQGVRGCNMAFWREDALSVNGFNEDFEGWGKEDSEFVVRMLNSGVKRKNLKFGAVAFHLHHSSKRNAEAEIQFQFNQVLLDEVIKNHQSVCENGIDKHLK